MELRPAALPLPCSHPWGSPYPEEGVQGTVLHELSDDHDRCALGDNAFQVDDIGVVELAHDGCFTQEVPTLLLCVPRLKGLDGDKDLSLAWELQVATADLTKLPWHRYTERGMVSRVGWEVSPPCPVIPLWVLYDLILSDTGSLCECGAQSRRVGPSWLPWGIWG